MTTTYSGTPLNPPPVMSSHYRSGSGSSDRPTLPPIRDLFGEELSQSPRPHHRTNSPSQSFSRLGFGDDDNRDDRRSSQNYAGRFRAPASQRSFSGNPTSHSPSMRPSSNLPYPETDRNIPNHPPSHSFSHPGHPNSRSSNDTPFRGGPSSTAYYPSGRSTPSNMPGLMPPRPPTAPVSHRSYSGGEIFYDSRSGRYQHASLRDYPEAQGHPSIAAGSSTMSRSMQETSSASSYIAKYECDYCGKGFNRPSSLKIHLNSHTGEKPFTCSFEGCGRSFSVLSNMRRHARTHSSVSNDAPEPYSEEESDEPSPHLTVSSIPPTPANISTATSSAETMSTPHQGHRDSNASGTRSRNRPVS